MDRRLEQISSMLHLVIETVNGNSWRDKEGSSDLRVTDERIAFKRNVKLEFPRFEVDDPIG